MTKLALWITLAHCIVRFKSFHGLQGRLLINSFEFAHQLPCVRTLKDTLVYSFRGKVHREAMNEISFLHREEYMLRSEGFQTIPMDALFLYRCVKVSEVEHITLLLRRIAVRLFFKW